MQVHQITVRRADRRLDEIKADLACCTKDVKKLRTDCNDLCKRMDKVEKNTADNMTKLTDNEAKLADLEDRSWKDNVRIMGIPEGTEGANASQYIPINLPKWFPSLGNKEIEVM